MATTVSGEFSRDSIWTWAVLGTLAVLLVLPQPCHAGAGSKPNIIYVLADDLGIGDVNVYGQRIGEVLPRELQTPSADRLAAEGMLFTQHYAGSTVCAPSRHSLLTGRTTGHCFIRGNRYVGGYNLPMPAADVTIAEMLKSAGYATACIGKWGLGGPHSEGSPGRQGFDYFYGYLSQTHAHYYYPNNPVGSYEIWEITPDATTNVTTTDFAANAPDDPTTDIYSHDVFTEKAKQFIVDAANDPSSRPFFLYLPYAIPHSRIEVPEIETAYRDKPWSDNMKIFASMITRMDEDVGEIVALLQALNIDNDTLMIFTSDNGPHSEGGHNVNDFDSNGIFRGLKRDMYEGGIRVPTIARWPGSIAAGSTTDHISAFWDVLPTFAELTGTSAPADIDGISFLPTLLGQPGQQQPANLYWEFHEQNGKQAIRQGKWKAVRLNVKNTPPDPLEIYDLDADPSERNNIATLQPDKVREFEDLMVGLRVPSLEFPLPIDSITTVVPPQDASGALAPRDFAKRLEISISGYTGATDLNDFPLLVRLGGAINGFSYDEFASREGGDLRFTAADGMTLLSHEIENWSPSGISSVWVKVPKITGDSARIFAYWGNPNDATAPQYSTNGAVWWASNQQSVHHLNDSLADSTAWHRDGTNSGSTNASPGAIADARAFSMAEGQLVRVGYTGVTGKGPRTISAWIQTPRQVAGEVKGIVSWGENTTGRKFTVRVETASAPGTLRCEVSGGYVYGTRRVDDDQWHHIAVVLPERAAPDVTDVLLYVDGEPEAFRGTSPQAIDTGVGSVRIGAAVIAGRTFDGVIDEVRIASVAHSADWIKACFENQKPGSTFLTTGPVEDVSARALANWYWSLY